MELKYYDYYLLNRTTGEAAVYVHVGATSASNGARNMKQRLRRKGLIHKGDSYIFEVYEYNGQRHRSWPDIDYNFKEEN